MFNTERKKADQVARAISDKRYDLAAEMLRAGARPDGIHRKNRDKPTALMLAVGHKQIGLTKLLIEMGADVNARDGDGDTALHYLDKTDNIAGGTLVHLLVAAGADINAKNHRGYTPLSQALNSYERAGRVAALLRHGASMEFDYSYYGPALVLASRRNEPEVIRELIAHGADINAAGRNGYTPLHMAASEGNGDVVRVLIELGADTQARDVKMNTPADLAQENKHFGIANFIRQTAGVRVGVDEGWVKVADDEIAKVHDKSAIGYRLTEIFNFTRGEATVIVRNVETGNESVTVRHFNDYAQQAVIHQAAEALQNAGGVLPDRTDGMTSGVLIKKTPLPKPKGA